MIFFGKREQEELRETIAELEIARRKIEELESDKRSLESDKQRIESLLTPEMKNVALINDKIQKLNAEIARKQEDIQKKSKKIAELQSILSEKQSQIIVADDILELETFSFYKPKYNMTNSADYKVKLDTIREKQKDMVKKGTAAIGAQTWTVNGSVAEGKRMIKDTIKLCLRSFNNECDLAVSSVRFNNYERCETRILKSAESIQKLGKIMNVSISSGYISLKIDELKLALEYALKKQEEKEVMKEFRARQKEEAIVAKEIEEARKTAEKERKHYENALKQIQAQISNARTAEESAVFREKESELSSRLDEISEQMRQIDYREANQKAGYVYIISNIGAFGENIYKIGMTRRLEPMDRIDELGSASVPFNFDVHALIFSNDAPKLEAALHRAFDDKKLNLVNTRREFFHVTLEEIKTVVRENHDKTVEFIDTPIAAQYRESLQLSGGKQIRSSTERMESEKQKNNEYPETQPENVPSTRESTPPAITYPISSECKDFIRGQRIKLSDIIGKQEIILDISLPDGQEKILDFACFGVNEDNKISDDRYFIFYNQTEAPNGSIELALDGNGIAKSFKINFGALPSTIKKIVCTVAIDGNISMGALDEGSINFCNGEQIVGRYRFDGSQYSKEKALILVEFYIKNQSWSVSVIGQGFNGGLEALLTHYGGTAIK